MGEYFIIAIGGTGMRCLESFVHMCAAGIFDDKEFHILTLDTDSQNGNKERTESLINLYNDIKRQDGQNVEGVANKNTFFSSKLTLYKYFTNLGDKNHGRDNYARLSTVNNQDDESKKTNEDLAELFLDRESVQQFDLAHGFRAQTHLGSMLMYHSIVEAAKNVTKNKANAKPEEEALCNFLDKMSTAGSNGRVFIFGSIFGGTGASSIPVLPEAFNKAIEVRFNKSLDFNNVKFGTTLLSQYFSFKNPDETQRKKEKGIIADSGLFALNSQAALQFYLNDATVKSCYKHLYHIGWPSEIENYSRDGENETITGGLEQKNRCHVVELLSACAAYDFFKKSDDDMKKSEPQYWFHGVETNASGLLFTGKTFVGDDADIFTNKLGAFLSLAHVILTKHEASRGQEGTRRFIQFLNQKDIHSYDTIKENELKQIDEYMRRFAYRIENNKVEDGWVYQICKSIKGKFIFKSNAFVSNIADLDPNSYDPGDLFEESSHNWSTEGGVFHTKTSYDKLIGMFKEPSNVVDENKHNVKTTKEKFLAHLYNTITKLENYKF